MNIYQVSEQYLLALNELLAIDGLTDDVIQDTIESLQGNMEDKARNVAAYILNVEAEEAAVGAAKDRMAVRQKSLGGEAARLRSVLTSSLQKCGISEVRGAQFNVRMKLNRAGVDVYDAPQIPAEFMTKKIEYSFNKCLIKEAIESGGSVPGARLERKTRLEIK